MPKAGTRQPVLTVLRQNMQLRDDMHALMRRYMLIFYIAMFSLQVIIG